MDYRILLNSPLFKGLTQGDITSAISSVQYRIRKFSPGKFLASSGDSVVSFMMVIRGIVKGEMADYSGRTIKIEDIPAPMPIASAFLFGTSNRFPVNVIAVTETEILVIEKADFLKFLNLNERLLSNFLDIISNRSQFLSEKIKFLNFKTIRGKLAQFILQTAGSDRNEITLSMTQSDIAEYFGVARPSIARVLSELEEEGIIQTKGKNLKILDRKRLTGITDEMS